MRELWRRLQTRLRRRSLDRDLEEELQFHLDMKTRERGNRAAATRALGNSLLLRERARDVWGWRWLDEVSWDIRYALRMLRQNPGFTAIAITMLALGIGVNGAVFTVTNGTLLRGTPHIDPANRIVYLQTSQGVSYPDFEDWRQQAHSFDGQMAVVFSGGNRSRLDDRHGPSEMYDATQLSSNAFRVLDQKPILGRDFSPSDEIPGAAPVMILSYHLWERRYGKDPAIIGQTVRINSVPASWGSVDLLTSTATTVIGVMPSGFRFPLYRVDLWLPLIPTAGMLVPRLHDRPRRNFMLAFGRLADGVTLPHARAEMEAIGRRLEHDYPSTNRHVVPLVKNFRDFWLGSNAVALYASMWAAVACVLLIVCANLANLLLAKAIGRSREMAIRIALGAGRWRIVRQLLIESVLLSTVGGLIGGVMAAWSVHTYNRVANDPYWYARWEYAVDYRVLAYLIGVSFITGVLCGLAPAVRLSRLDTYSILKDGGRGALGGRRGTRVSTVLVMGEMALALVLLAGAGIMIRSVLTIATSDLGIQSATVVTGLIGLPQGRYPDAPAQISLVHELTARLTGIPGVESVAISTGLPAGAVFRPVTRAYELDGRVPAADDRGRASVATIAISADYFRTLGATVRQGRPFTEGDQASGLPVVVVNQRFASLSWPGEDAIGKRMRLFNGGTDAWLTVVGVVSNVVQDDRTGQQFDPVVYRPFPQEPATVLWVLASTRVPPGSVAKVLRRDIAAIDPDLLAGPGAGGVVLPLDELLKNNYRSNAVNGMLFVIFAAIALLLASTGLYAVVAHAVSRRTQEIGIRMAMGATARDIRTLVFRQGMRPVAVGLTIGLAGALAVTPLLQSQLVGVSAADPRTFAVAAAVLVLSAAFGCWIPARRAMRIEPAVALRDD